MRKVGQWTEWDDERITDNHIEISNKLDEDEEVFFTVHDPIEPDELTVFLNKKQLLEIKNHIEELLKSEESDSLIKEKLQVKSPLRLLKDELSNKGYNTRFPAFSKTKLIMETPNKNVYIMYESDMYVVKMFDNKTHRYDYGTGIVELSEAVKAIVRIAEIEGKFCTRGKNTSN